MKVPFWQNIKYYRYFRWYFTFTFIEWMVVLWLASKLVLSAVTIW